MKYEPRIGVAVIVRRDDGAILMGQRIGGNGAGTWSVPGGKPEPGERMVDTAFRELEEETGIVALVAHGMRVWNETTFPDGSTWVTLWYVTTPLSPRPRVCEPDKCAEWRWIASRAEANALPGGLFSCLLTAFDAGLDPWSLP